MTAAYGRSGRDELLARISELETENARLAADQATMLETLTHAQARGSELQDEVRSLRRVLDRWFKDCADVSWSYEEQRSLQFEILVDLLKVRWRGDCKYGSAEAHADLPLGFGDALDDFVLSARTRLVELRKRKAAHGNHTSFFDVVAEEFCELVVEGDEARVEAEALDVANVALKMVESIRIRRSRAGAAK